MSLSKLFSDLADACDGTLKIEQIARDALRTAAPYASFSGQSTDLAVGFTKVMSDAEAHPACQTLMKLKLPWAPPTTSDDPKYVAHSTAKAHVELIGPEGLVTSDNIRLGVYGIDAQSEYGLRTHLAEEIFIMLAGHADWKRGKLEYQTLGPGMRAHHPSMMPHATRTTNSAFMSLYVWIGDVSTDSYIYSGLPTD